MANTPQPFAGSCRYASSPDTAPLPGARYTWHSVSPCGDSAPWRYSVPLYRLGAAKFPSFGTFSSNLWNSVRNFSNPWNMGPPAARAPPIKWGPVRYAPCFFLIFAGKLKHRETVTHCDLPLRFNLCSSRCPPHANTVRVGPHLVFSSI